MTIKGLIEAKDITQPKFKIAIIGESGIGKSWLATSIAAPDHEVLDLDFDDRAPSLAGKPNVTVKTYKDSDFNKPTAMAELQSDISEWEYDYVQKRLKFKTFIIDSMSFMRKAMERDIIIQQPTLGKGIKMGAVVLKVAADFNVYKGNQTFAENIISRLSAIGNLIVTFHERSEKDEVRSTTEKTIYTGMVSIDPPHLAVLLSTFNDVWRLTTDYSSKRVLYTGLVKDFAGKTTFKGLDDVEIPDIQKMLAKHQKFLSTSNGAKVTPITQINTQTTQK